MNQFKSIDYHFLFNEIQQKILSDKEMNHVGSDYFQRTNFPNKNTIVN